jgi:hypothetical protein
MNCELSIHAALVRGSDSPSEPKAPKRTIAVFRRFSWFILKAAESTNHPS